MYCLYMSVSVSLSWPNVVPVSALSVLSLVLHLFVMFVMCGPNDMDVLYVRPNINVSCWCFMGLLLRVSVGAP